MKVIKTTFTTLLMIALTLCINVRGQNVNKFVLGKPTSAYIDLYGNVYSTVELYSSDSLPKNYKNPTLKDVEELAKKSPTKIIESYGVVTPYEGRLASEGHLALMNAPLGNTSQFSTATLDKKIISGIPDNFGKVVAFFANGQIDSAMTKHLNKIGEYPSVNKSIEIGAARHLAVQATYPKTSDITRVTLLAKTDPALDTCKREYIALSRTYEDLKQDYADVVYINSMDKIYTKQAHEKELKKAKRKRWFNGFLWGNVVGILALAFVMK